MFYIIYMKNILNIKKQREREKRREKLIIIDVATYENFLQGINGLISDGYSIDFSNFITDMKSGLSMDHPTVHNSCYYTFSIFVHFQGNPLESE